VIACARVGEKYHESKYERIFAPSLCNRRLALATLATSRVLAADKLPLTASGPIGPFYPIERLADADLTFVKGRKTRALGKVIEVSGRVLDRHGNPVSGAQLELWQANSVGRYAHAEDIAKAPLDHNFQGFASLKTGASGEWRFKTIKPAAYDSPIGKRTPHIHFDIRGKQYRMISQMYFSDDHVMNDADMLYKRLGKDATTAVAKQQDADRYRWDIILMEG
jgi:protocatechuate 3,4-dioxygenase beta subunit